MKTFSCFAMFVCLVGCESNTVPAPVPTKATTQTFAYSVVYHPADNFGFPQYPNSSLGEYMRQWEIQKKQSKTFGMPSWMMTEEDSLVDFKFKVLKFKSEIPVNSTY